MAELIRCESTDVDDQAQSLMGYRQTYEQLGRGRFCGSLWQLAMSRGILFRESTNLQLRQQVVPPPDHVALAVPVQVAEGSKFAGRPLSPESLMVLTGDEDYQIALAGGACLIGLSVHREILAAQAPAKVEWLQRAERVRHLTLTRDVAAAIRDLLLATSAEAQNALDHIDGPHCEAALLSSTLAQAVILAMTGDELPHQIPRRVETRQRVVSRAIEYMRAHVNDDVSVAEICSAACASRRSLQYCFEEFLHTTPQAYFRALRLNEARRLLKAKRDTSITIVANEFGFSSASHFTRHYRLMFDELPSQAFARGGSALGATCAS